MDALKLHSMLETQRIKAMHARVAFWALTVSLVVILPANLCLMGIVYVAGQAVQKAAELVQQQQQPDPFKEFNQQAQTAHNQGQQKPLATRTAPQPREVKSRTQKKSPPPKVEKSRSQQEFEEERRISLKRFE
jgi:hypothetical protein